MASSSRSSASVPFLSLLKSKWTRTSQEPFLEARLTDQLMQFIDANTGILLVASSQLFFSMMNVGVKLAANWDSTVHTLELIALRMTITYICCIFYMYMTNVPDIFLGPKEVRHLLLLRGICGFTGIFGLYFSLQYLSLSDATVLTFLVPLSTAVSGALILKEKISVKEVIAGLCSLFGVILIARPPILFGSISTDASEDITASERLVAVSVSLLGVCGATGAYTTLRAIGHRSHPMHSLVAFAGVSVIASAIAMLCLRIPFVIPKDVRWILLLLFIGVSGFIAQTLFTMGIQRETAGRAANALYIQIVFAVVLERILFKTIPTVLSVLGTAIIVVAAIYVAVIKKTDTEPIEGMANGQDLALEEGLLSEFKDDS